MVDLDLFSVDWYFDSSKDSIMALSRHVCALIDFFIVVPHHHGWLEHPEYELSTHIFIFVPYVSEVMTSW